MILNGHKFLVDCGESTLLQLLFNNIKIEEIDAVFVTHEHADHYLGLASFLQAYHGKTGAYPHVYCQELVKLFLDMQGICSTSVHVIDPQRPQYA